MKHLFTICVLALGIMGTTRSHAQTEVTFYTSMGGFKIMLTDSLTPVTVDSFLARVNRGFYDDLTFHRVIKNFMIQGGDPQGTGSGGTGTTIPDEFHPSLKNIKGALAMANTGTANTGDCQFYINVVTNSHLDNKHTVFGMVTEYYDVVHSISRVKTSAQTNRPTTPVTMDSVRVGGSLLSVKKLNGGLIVGVYPNPNKGIFSIELPDNKSAEVEIYDLQGRSVYNAKATGKHSADLRSQPAGVYTVRVSNENAVSEHRIVIQ